MKSRIPHCEKCERECMKQQKQICDECQYDIFSAITDDVSKSVVAAALSAQVRRGRTKEYIQKYFEDIIFEFEMPELLGKTTTNVDIIKILTEKYGIDFDRIHMKIECKEEFMKRR